MKVVDVIHVIGRGWVVICNEDNDLICGDIVTVNDKKFTVVGIEKATFVNQMGYVLSPNNEVKDNIVVGSDLYIHQLYGRTKVINGLIKVHFQKSMIYSVSDRKMAIVKFVIGRDLVFFERKSLCYVRVAERNTGFGPLIPIKEKFDELESLIKTE